MEDGALVRTLEMALRFNLGACVSASVKDGESRTSYLDINLSPLLSR